MMSLFGMFVFITVMTAGLLFAGWIANPTPEEQRQMDLEENPIKPMKLPYDDILPPKEIKEKVEPKVPEYIQEIPEWTPDPTPKANEPMEMDPSDIPLTPIKYNPWYIIHPEWADPKMIEPKWAEDPDPDRKDGGKDPLVLRENWGYFDFDGAKCDNGQNRFDYDNDGFREHMCYWYTPETKIFFSDKFNGTLINGHNFAPPFTHLWQDKNSNVMIDKGELDNIITHVEMTINYPDGVKDSNGRYAYCVGESDQGEFVCTKPTYWMKGIP